MNHPISVRQAQLFDKFAQEKLGIPSIVLMENAGRGVSDEAIRVVGLQGGSAVAIVCGTGNNGGDGFVAARHLINAGCRVGVFIVGLKAKIKNDPKLNLNILQKMGQRIKFVRSKRDLRDIMKSNLIIDALFGIGLNSPITGLYRDVIEMINDSCVPVLSVDVPSGLDADTGKVLGAALRANKTVTFIAPKKGFFKADGPVQCGKIIVRDIGIGKDALRELML